MTLAPSVQHDTLAELLVLVADDDRGLPLGVIHRHAPDAGSSDAAADGEPRAFLSAAGRPSPAMGEANLRIAWDGRIDNRDEVVTRLGLHAADARGLSDDEIVAKAYVRWGDGLVNELIGDWAFALWDAARRRLLCAKDPLGWRPLFYGRHEGVLRLATDFRTILAGGFPTEPNLDFAYRYLADAGRIASDTAYRGISALLGGQRLIAEAGEVRVETFWDRPRIVERTYRDSREYVEEFEHLVENATRAMMRDGEQTGIYLSGGLDSSYVAVVAAKFGHDLKAISSYAPGTTWDEREYQQIVRDHSGLSAVELDITDCTALDERYVTGTMFDTPEVPPQHSLHVATARATADAGVQVVLSGIGGDEWLSGNPNFLADAVVRGHPRQAWDLAHRAAPRVRRSRVLGKSLYHGLVPLELRGTMDRVRGRDHWSGLLPLVTPEPDWLGRAQREANVAWRREEGLQRRWRSYRSDASGAVEWLDRHAHRPLGIEFRSPLNDLRVVEYLAGVPDWVKRFEGRPKDILRSALQRAGLPESLYGRRDKASYDEPYDRGLRDLARSRVDAAIEAVCALPRVDADRVHQETRAWLEDEKGRWEPTWRAVSTGLWLLNCGHPATVGMPSERSVSRV